jgi:DNA mismatch repair protein MutS
VIRDPAFDPPQAAYEAPPPDPNATPSMAQYIEIKAANPDCLLFYRMGDFYELFFRDAEIAARTLGIVLTRRGKHAGEDIPMCGVPVSRSDEYLHRLIAAGHRVAICEQLEDPAEARKRGSKAVVKRDVVRIVTPGTITEEGLLEATRASRLAAIARQKTGERSWQYAIGAVELSTGEFGAALVQEVDLAGEIARIDPRELLVPDAVLEDPALQPLWAGRQFAITRLAKDGYDPASAADRLKAFFRVSTLDAFGDFARPEIAAMGALIAYLERTQLGQKAPLQTPRRGGVQAMMAIDAATRANLEITRTLQGERAGSLLSVVDRTVTAPGGRLLAHWLASPLLDRSSILDRLDAVAALVAERDARALIRHHLATFPDITRAQTRLALDRAGPRDLAAIADGIIAAEQLGRDLVGHASLAQNKALDRIRTSLLAAPVEAARAVRQALADFPPLQKREPGFIRDGFDAELDQLRALNLDSKQVIAGLQARYAEEADARTLRIKHNNQLGYFIEVPQAVGERLIQPAFQGRFVHRQTMAGAMRFTTTELAGLELKILEAADQAQKREMMHFVAFVAAFLESDQPIRSAADAVAEIDVFASLAELADVQGWCRPELTHSLEFSIENGRHPVVEAALKRGGEGFIANACDLSGGEAGARIMLVTGANMAGKSTFLRQNALIAILAQMGSFVPASSARIGLVDRLFSRVGAADDLARGRSTFMVEMVETAAILNQAGPRALVILDEIGRGTATYDGLSIAWAAIEHLHDHNRCRALFATHFHELTGLTKRLPRLQPMTMKVTTYRGEVVFLHEVVPGAADRSYGIQVARLAGLPNSVVQRAQTILAELERSDRAHPRLALLDDLPLFRAADPVETTVNVVQEALSALNPDEMSPREAHEALYRLKALLRN